ncbi:MAG: TIGR02444 family protein [Alphaproteobacteria bacterium]|nr:TIGR02444 family protein [Alphaproteobacteria bacterium]MBU1514181.1 TIGR02444 family protein [Alphaproteobacteria bacterium]MBU2096170.1 TIGR02444 family protein [Alphaproteobacteria bacterium]MBU2151124.1 TIGR02444 family protein [Alphaproteobacteria bacterium]MBU2307217.1 TIGR02444 family protein [Alphaproteobacteria bacterium]
MAIWDWVLEAYGRPGVPEACLTLQDVHGQNTSLLLWAVRAEVKDAELLARAAEATRAWERTALVPIREVRRALKAPQPPVDDVARLALREDVKGLELAAERLLLETLDGMSQGRGGAHALEALEAAAKAWEKPAPAGALAELAAALG